MATTSAASTIGPAVPTSAAAVRLRPVGLDDVHVTAGLWHQRAEVNRTATVPAGLRQLRAADNVQNLEIVAGRAEGEARGPIFADSDIHKWLEAAAWEYGRSGGQELMEAMLDLTASLAEAQAEDGYLNSVVQLREGARYANLPWSHEHYCAGHLIQAALAFSRTTGRTELLDVAVRFADHLVATFGPDGIRDVDGHPVIEMALVELYRETGTRAYLDLAAWFVDARGHGNIAGHGHEPTYFSDRVPVREASTVEGHAVRAVYLAAGAADVAVETGDVELLETLKIQFDAMVGTKQYVTGGLGSRWEGEAFGDPYELPNDRAYAETCAAIGGVQWAWRMLLATGESRYADQIELMLYNGMLAGVSLTGTEFFYVNALHLREDAHPDEERSPAHGRRGWFDCACCPPNVMRTLSSLEGLIATTGDDESVPSLQIHQFAPGRIQAADCTVEVETDYPWNGEIRLTIQQAPVHDVAVMLRVPAWAEGATLDGEPVAAGGYAAATRTWSPGETLTLLLPMTPRFVRAHPRVDAARGSVALLRGPLVHAFEAGDQAEGVVLDDVSLDPNAEVTAEPRPELLDGVTLLRTSGRRHRASAAVDAAGTARAAGGGGDPVSLTAVPYFAWANRGPQAMRVWIPTS
ncbi:glycoside hydrolase family 127 protein [Nesterenkonia halophila]|uniref:glycoside hydrolase family 127 protein n=1 Tax=Nesterenkonia halophila TaxID=302044 RepID=UPI0012911858|nr:beta-L-arabinofuranosidase domain-containing protein [Nesterenkonia halophila]